MAIQMTITLFQARGRWSPCHFLRLCHSATLPQLPHLPADSNMCIGDICRILSDFRGAHHDIESALAPFSKYLSTNTVNQVLKRCRNLGLSAHRFFLWVQKVSTFSLTQESHQILMDILGSSKQFPFIWDLLSEMRDGSIKITPDIFWVIFRSYAKVNLPADAIRAFNRMPEFGLQPRIEDLDKLLSFLCRNHQASYAQEFFDKVKGDFPVGSKTYSIIMQGWGELGNPDKALQMFDEMLKRGCPLDVVAYNTILASLCKGKLVNTAHKLFCQMGSHGLEPNACTYSTFIHAACEGDDVRTAIRILDSMKRYGLVPNSYTYNCIIKLLCKNDKIDDAHKILNEMIETGISPDVWSYNAVLAAHCSHCEVNRALGVLSRMKKESCQPDRHTYNMILKMLIQVGRVDRAMELWEGMAMMGFHPSVSTYSVMIHGLCKKKGRIEDACRYFEMMVNEGIPPYSCTCTMLRERLWRLGLRDRIFILVDKMQKSTSCSIQELAESMSSSSMSMRTVRPRYVIEEKAELEQLKFSKV